MGGTLLSFRLAICERASCRKQFTLCSHCDRGNRYCGDECRKQARRQTLKLAGDRHQRSPEGARDHADRQARFRERQKKVTHQGSSVCGDLLQPRSPEPESTMVVKSHGFGSEEESEKIPSAVGDFCDSGSAPTRGSDISGGSSGEHSDESPIQFKTHSAKSLANAFGGAFDVDWHTGPVCACCGARGTMVRYGFFRSLWRRAGSNTPLSNRSG